MASPSSSHHTASQCGSPWAGSASTTAPAAAPTPAYPAWAQFLTAPNPATGSSTVSAAGLAPPQDYPAPTATPTMEAVIRMIWDTQQSIGVLSIAMSELTHQVNDLVQVQTQASTLAPTEHSAKATKSMVACSKPWDGKGDSAAARHFLAAFANWASSQKEKMNRQSVFGIWLKKDLDWIQAVLNLMEGNACMWCLPALERLRKDKEPFNGDWAKFEDAFTKRFIPQDPSKATREALKHLTQGKKSVAEYKAKFEEHSSLTGWSKADLRSRFYDGLADAIKDALAISDRPTEAYKSLVEATQVLDIHLRQCQAEKKGQTFHQTSS